MKHCHDCGVAPGELHTPGCDTERCPTCGGQMISCGHRSTKNRMPWTGEWPGVAECRSFGWYAYEVKDDIYVTDYIRCEKYHPGAREDLNRLYEGEAVWSREQRRFVLRSSSAPSAAQEDGDG